MVEEARAERDETETRCVRELEDIHDGYMQKAQEADAQHAEELEALRAQLLEAKRNLRTSQLAAQRLTERINKLETHRPARSSARADFESFIAKVGADQVPGPGEVAGSPRPRPGPRTASGAPPAGAPAPRTPAATAPVPKEGLEGQAGLANPERTEEPATLVMQPEADAEVGSEIDDFLRQQFEGYGDE